MSWPSLLAPVAAVLALCAADVLLATKPAMAQQGFGNFFTYQPSRPRRVMKKKRTDQPEAATAGAEKVDVKPETKKDAKKEADNKGGLKQPVYVVVSLADQHATVYDANGVVTRTRVSTGQPGHRTPTGMFTVIGKSRYHRSNIYSGAPMPFMQRITWSGVAMHAGVVPGYPASHGCIRLPASFAPQLYKMTEMGARVVVSPTDIRPVEIAHPFLPLPKMQEAPAMPASPEQQASNSGSVELASVEATGTTDNSTPPPKLLNPIAYAGALKQSALASKAAADLAAKNALAAAQAAGADARTAVDDVRKAETELAAATAKRAAIETRAAAASPRAQSAAAIAPAAEAAPVDAEKTAVEADIARINSALEEARSRESTKNAAAFAAVEAYKTATAASEAADKLVAEADRRREHVSVLISRKEGRVFIRQDWKEVWEAPVTIRDSDRPLGTHVYSAIEPAADGSAMRWISISMPPERAAAPARRGRDKDKDAVAVEVPSSAPETAASALDRIELPEGARERISELLWQGGSLIVSDQPRSPEMSEEATDFIVLTR
jgi:lipoprotein-anchoring transpeptidase ErfK/SrfK